jgi:hypothetical protein
MLPDITTSSVQCALRTPREERGFRLIFGLERRVPAQQRRSASVPQHSCSLIRPTGHHPLRSTYLTQKDFKRTPRKCTTWYLAHHFRVGSTKARKSLQLRRRNWPLMCSASAAANFFSSPETLDHHAPVLRSRRVNAP